MKGLLCFDSVSVPCGTGPVRKEGSPYIRPRIGRQHGTVDGFRLTWPVLFRNVVRVAFAQTEANALLPV